MGRRDDELEYGVCFGCGRPARRREQKGGKVWWHLNPEKACARAQASGEYTPSFVTLEPVG